MQAQLSPARVFNLPVTQMSFSGWHLSQLSPVVPSVAIIPVVPPIRATGLAKLKTAPATLDDVDPTDSTLAEADAPSSLSVGASTLFGAILGFGIALACLPVGALAASAAPVLAGGVLVGGAVGYLARVCSPALASCYHASVGGGAGQLVSWGRGTVMAGIVDAENMVSRARADPVCHPPPPAPDKCEEWSSVARR